MPAIPPAMPLRLRAYLDATVDSLTTEEGLLVSLILFGSAATGGFTEKQSDIDLIVVVRDGLSAAAKRRVQDVVTRLEAEHHFRAVRSASPGAFEAFAE